MLVNIEEFNLFSRNFLTLISLFFTNILLLLICDKILIRIEEEGKEDGKDNNKERRRKNE
jgi:hypothetical protein